jgi:uncharacterized protein YndB with AHSA1/START domain
MQDDEPLRYRAKVGSQIDQGFHNVMTPQVDRHTLPAGGKVFTKTVKIDAPTSSVWEALTNAELMKKWMFETEIHIITDWKIGSPIVIRGNMNGKDFENKGTVLKFVPRRILQYSHLSSLSRLLDKPENYSILEFRLVQMEGQTTLTLTVINFPTESIYKHLAFYWNVAPEVLKRMLEEHG